MENLRVAAVIMNSVVGRMSDNLDKIESFAHKAASQGVQLACFPEASITGYTIGERIFDFAEPVPGPSSEALMRISKSTGLTILCGLIEKGKNGNIFISHIVASPQGLGEVYRKLHLAPNEERIYSQGEKTPIYNYGRASFGIQLCYDTHFPELTTALALMGAEILFLPYASPHEKPSEKRERWLRYLSARAYDNSIFVVACNQVGSCEAGGEFPGVALILDPKGRILKEACGAGEKIVMADLRENDLAEVRESKLGFFLNRRRPDIYGELNFSPGHGKVNNSSSSEYN